MEGYVPIVAAGRMDAGGGCVRKIPHLTSAWAKWMKQPWYSHTMDYSSAVKMTKILPFATAGMDLENIMLSEIASQRKTNTIRFHSYVESTEPTNKQNRDRLRDSEQADSSQGRGAVGERWSEEEKELMGRDNCGECRGCGWR